MSPTILLIPGLMNDGWVYTQQLPALSRLGPVMVACNDGLDDLGAMAARALAATHGPLAVVGHSMGGRVALEMVAQAPDRIVALALLGTGAHGPRPGEVEDRRRLIRLAHDEGMDAVIEAWLPAMMAADADPATRAGVVAMLRRCSPGIFAGQQEALSHRPDRTALLSTIACPTLVATGEHDDWAPPAQHAALAAPIPHARLETIAGAGHMLPVEAPERLGALLVAFLGGSG